MMTRRLGIRAVVFGMAVLVVSHCFLEWPAPAFSQGVSEEAKAALKERDRLRDQTQKLRAAGRSAEAIAAAEAMLAIERKVLPAGNDDIIRSLSWLAQLHADREEFAAARTARLEILELLRKRYSETHWKVVDARLAMQDVVRRSGMTHQQRQKLTEADRLNQEFLVLYRSGKNREALQPARRVLALRKEVLGERHPLYATSLGNLANLLVSQGDYAAARPLLEQAVAIDKGVLGERHPDYATSLSNLGFLLWAQRDYARAAPFLKQALETTQGNLDLAAAAQSERQQLAMALNLRVKLDAYLSLAPLAGLPAGDTYRHVLASKGAVFERQRRLRAQRRRLQTDPRSQAAQRFTDYQQTVKQLATLALGTPDPKQAQAWREKVAELSRRKDELEAELARLDAGFRTERAEASRTPEQLQAALPPGTALVDLLVYTAYQPPARGQGNFQRERRLVAFVVRPDRPIAQLDLGPLAPILKAIDEWRPILISRQAAPVANDPAQRMRRLIWEPVEAHLEGITTVLVAPDGALGLVPLAALPGKEPNRYLIEERSIAVVPVPRLLGSTATVSPAPGQGTGPAQAEPAPSLLLVGDIDYGGEPGKGDAVAMSRSAAVGTRAGALPDFPSLPATGDEIASIGRSFRNRFRGAEELELDRDQATEEALRREAPRHRFLHLATHGYFAPQELRSALGPGDKKGALLGIDALGGAGVAGYHPGLLSGIALAGANRRPTPVGQDDGILTALEVAELDLSGVELAVLSACETGLGEVAGGEGLLGLQRAFQVAGAHSVVASLWKVGDEPTRALMARLYENLWRKGQPPVEALREAQLYMLREGRRRGLVPLEQEQAAAGADRLPPFYWAAFVLSTDRPATQRGGQEPQSR